MRVLLKMPELGAHPLVPTEFVGWPRTGNMVVKT